MLKKLVVLVAGCVCTLLLSTAANAATVSKGIVNADALNVRSVPSTDGAVLGLLPTNSEVIVLSHQDNWYKIYFNNQEAYVSADYVIITATNVEFNIPDSSYVPSYIGNQYTVPASNGVIPSYAGSQIPGEMLVEISKQFIGTPYVYGGMSPSGFDCSGFVKYCYSLMGVNINRVSYDQALNGVAVPVEQMLPGDIICFNSSVGSSYIGHTGIYVGNGYFIHSPRTGYSVEILPLDSTSYGQRINTVRRIF